MKSAVIVVAAVAIFLGSAHAGVLDGVIENLLEGLRQNLTDLVLPDIDTSINNVTGVQLNLTTANITATDLDTYEIAALKTTLLPLRLDQLELRWAQVSLGGLYKLDGTLDIDALQGPVAVTGEGTASLIVRNVTLRVEAVGLNSKGGHLSIKDIGLMTVSMDETLVFLENIFGETDENMTEIINVFLGFFLTEFVNDSGDDILLQLKPFIIEKLDEILADVHFP